jgi:carbon storage regulator
MLVLSRKELQTVRIGDDITITVLAIAGGRVRIGIGAPREVTVLRGELATDGEEVSTPLGGDL